jgi:hypothetical protein
LRLPIDDIGVVEDDGRPRSISDGRYSMRTPPVIAAIATRMAS